MPHMTGPADMVIDAILSKVQQENADTALLGPIVFDADEVPYFLIVFGRETGTSHMQKVGSPDDEQLEEVRADVIKHLLCRPGTVIHDFEDELQLIDVGVAYWPQRFTALRASVNDERRTTLH